MRFFSIPEKIMGSNVSLTFYVSLCIHNPPFRPFLSRLIHQKPLQPNYRRSPAGPHAWTSPNVKNDDSLTLSENALDYPFSDNLWIVWKGGDHEGQNDPQNRRRRSKQQIYFPDVSQPCTLMKMTPPAPVHGDVSKICFPR